MITWRDVKPGAIVTEPGGARKNKTGDWRSLKPCYNKDRCIQCGFCYIVCPDAAVRIESDGHVSVNDYYCKGCGICTRECPVGALKMVGLSEDDRWENEKA